MGEILMLELSKNEKWCCATILNGFRLWSIYEEKCIALKLPNGVRNISKKFNNSNNIILSAGDKLAVSGIRQEIIVWDMDTGCLVKRLIAHFQRIVEIKSLVTETENAVLTSSIDLMDLSQKRIIKSIPFWDGTCSKDGRYGLYAPATGGMEMLDLRTGRVCKTLIPKVAEGIFDVMAVFNATMEYVLYYHSGRKTIRAFRRKDGKMIANFRVQADLKGMETTTDGRSVVLGFRFE